jgi:hypothetical protein
MWIKVADPGNRPRVDLLCDECGVIFASEDQRDRRTNWRMANIAGWIRTARVPERHACADC